MVYRRRPHLALNRLAGVVRSLVILVCIGDLPLSCIAADETADASKKSPASVSEPTPLDVAKRQFQNSQQQNKVLPEQNTKTESLPFPSFQMPGSESLSDFLRQRKVLDKRKGRAKGNWLVDGVLGTEGQDKQKDSKTKNRDRQENITKDESAKETDDPDAFLESIMGESKSSASSQRAPTVLITPQVDPLQPFMEKWMSAKDYDLLVRPSAGVAMGSSEVTHTMGFTEGEGARINFQPDLGHRLEFSRPSSSPAENPFLKSMESWTPAQSSQPAPAASLPPSLSADREDLRNASSPGEKMTQKELQGLFKPADDRKYFPQLKRF